MLAGADHDHLGGPFIGELNDRVGRLTDGRGVVGVDALSLEVLAGRLAERYGIVPVLRVAALIYGVGLIVGAIPTTLDPLLIALPVVAIAGAIVMTLPQALAFTVAPPGGAGVAAGLLDFSRGLGVVLGPIVVGAAIELFHGRFGATHGYAAMWPAIGIPVLASLLFLRGLEPTAQAAATA